MYSPDKLEKAAAIIKERVVSIETLADIHKVIRDYSEDAEPQKQEPIKLEAQLSKFGLDAEDLAKVLNEFNAANVEDVKLQAELKAPNPREMLLEGLKLIKERLEMEEKIDSQLEADYGGYLPADNMRVQYFTWVDDMIRKWMGGRREGLKIRWSILEGEFEWDPYTGDFREITNDFIPRIEE